MPPRHSWQPIPRLWPDATVVVAASGPSLTQEQVDQVRGRARLIVINTTYRRAPWADLLYSADHKWWTAHSGAPEFAGLKVTQVPIDRKDSAARPYREAAERWGLRWVPSVNKPDLSLDPAVKQPGLSLDPAVIHQGSNSGFQSLNLAVLLGACRIVLIGFDMRAVEGRGHWHGSHPAGLNNPDDSNYSRWREALAMTPPDLERAGVEVVNATPGSALDCFPKMTLEEVL